jgi:16S rRNA (guanine1207-N2)-methyltransferase
MTRWAADPEAAASALIESALDDIGIAGRVLTAHGSPSLTDAISARGANVLAWNRRTTPRQPNVTPWPPDGPFALALLRLPKTRDEQMMAIHALLNGLAPGGRLIVYGGNDEGIKSTAKHLADIVGAEVAGDVTTVATRGHGRILAVQRPADITALKVTLAAWRQTQDVSIAGATKSWASYPGVFADGGLDAGTALLLAHLPLIKTGSRVLDYGCGTGIIAAHILARDSTARVAMLDNDSAALLAARENVPDAQAITGHSIADAGKGQYDLIISNPPLHVGIREDHAMLESLIGGTPRRLLTGGALILIVQRRIGLAPLLAQHFKTADILADNGRYRVWRAV